MTFQGDFEDFFNRYNRYIYSIAFRILSNHADAEDAMQNILMKIFENKHLQSTKIRKLKSWLGTVTTHAALDIMREKKRISEKECELMKKMSEDSYQYFDAETEDETKDSPGQIIDAIPELSPEHKEVLLLQHVQNMKVAEIAREINLPIGTVKSRLFHARKNLQAKMKKTKE